MNHQYIKDFMYGTTVASCYILQDFRVGTTKNDTKYLSATLKDNSGTISAKLWSYCDSVSANDVGKIVFVEGSVDIYQNNPQIVLSGIRSITLNDMEGLDDLSALVPMAPIDVDDEMHSISWTIYSMTDEDYKAICQEMINRYEKKFRVFPAAKSVHHSFRSGLLMHTTNMLILAEYIADIYKTHVNRDLLLAGVLLHDIGKIKEFTVSELGLVTDYSIDGKLMGHAIICAEEITEIADKLGTPEEKVRLLKHLILSHHGKPEHGAAVVPVCLEAELLSCIDMLDSRVEIYSEATANISPGEFSPRVYALDKQVLKHQ